MTCDVRLPTQTMEVSCGVESTSIVYVLGRYRRSFIISVHHTQLLSLTLCFAIRRVEWVHVTIIVYGGEVQHLPNLCLPNLAQSLRRPSPLGPILPSW